MKKARRFVHVIMFTPAVIGLVVVVRRVLSISGVIAAPPPLPGAAAVDTEFARHPLITFLHILPGALFMLLGPLQFLPGIRGRYAAFHRSSGLIIIICGYIIGMSALAMPFVLKPVGGLNEAAATTFFAIYFLIALTIAWRAILRRNITRHRQWMIRMFSVGVAVGTIRPIVALFFVFSGLPHRYFSAQHFGWAFHCTLY